MPDLQADRYSRRWRAVLLTAAALGLAVLVALLAWLFDVLVQPELPRSVVMITGTVDGAYHASRVSQIQAEVEGAKPQGPKQMLLDFYKIKR